MYHTLFSLVSYGDAVLRLAPDKRRTVKNQGSALKTPCLTVNYKNQLSETSMAKVNALGKLLIVLFSPPMQVQNTDTVFEFAKAAVEEGHEVTVFCDTDAVYNLLASQILPNQQVTPASKISELIGRGVRVLACRESARLRGVDTKKMLIQGVVESSLGRLAELMDESDRVVAFGA